MDLEAELLKEHSKKQCNRIVAYIGPDKKRFARLMELFFIGEYRVTQRAAWPVSYAALLHPELIRPYLDKMINNLHKEGLHDAVKRNTLRILQDIPIPNKHHGKLMNLCFDYIRSNAEPAAIKAFSLTILQRLSIEYPEISMELKCIIEDRWEHETAAFRSRAKKILKPI